MFLGVDGGGSGTAVCLVRCDGIVAARLAAPSLYYLEAGIGLVPRVLEEIVAQACERAGITRAQIAYAFFGLPTYGEIARDRVALDAAPRAALGHARYACDNDMVCGWAGSLAGLDGINVIAGTGSMSYGRRDGVGIRVGGWGAQFGDEGSAYWIAVRGLNLATRMSDGRLAEGPLLRILRAELELERDVDLVDLVVNRWRGARRKVAALSRLVSAAAEAGDELAGGVLDAAGRELASLVHATRRRLGYAAGDAVPVSHSGGVLGVPRVRAALGRTLDALADGYALRPPRFDPAAGAAIHAARLAGTPLSPGALERLAAG